MASRLNPYLTFDGNARQAMEFYKNVFGGTLKMNTFSELMSEKGAHSDNIMHAMLETPKGFTLMGSDNPPDAKYNPGENISISLSGDDDKELRGYWDKLCADGTVTMKLERQPWGDDFGMCVDKFGIAWMVNITRSPS